MNRLIPLPRVLVIDDQFGRVERTNYNADRRGLCRRAGLLDVTQDHDSGLDPVQDRGSVFAEVVFFRGQKPIQAKPGDLVENDLAGCIEAVRRGWTARPVGTAPWAVVIVDLCFYTGEVTAKSEARDGEGMPVGRDSDHDTKGYFGFEVIRALRKEFADLPVIVLSSMAREDVEVSRAFSDLGVFAFVDRKAADLRNELQQRIDEHGLLPDTRPRGIIGSSVPLLKALRQARRVAQQSEPVLLEGETGTGKELFAGYIALLSQRRRPAGLTKVNSAGLSSTLFQSELFGHKRGAFTDAKSDREGLMVEAEGGTLFLDEIQNMPEEVQAGLLRAIQHGEIRPLGSGRDVKVDVRFLAATNADVEAEVAAGRFRRDLKERIEAGGRIRVPALRERIDDLPALIHAFVEEVRVGGTRVRMRDVASDAMTAMRNYSWPGNVRQLRSTVVRAAREYPEADFLTLAHLPADIGENRSGPAVAPGGIEDDPVEPLAEAPKEGSNGITSPPPLQRRSPAELNACFDQVVAEFHQQLADSVEACLAAYRDPRTGRVNYSGAYRLAVPSAERSANASADAKRWFRKLFAGKNGLVGPIPARAVVQRPLLAEAFRWACGKDPNSKEREA